MSESGNRRTRAYYRRGGRGRDLLVVRCGRSQTQPFCDGSHKVTDFQPLEWAAKRAGKRNFCTCKRTKNPPFCDNSHLKL